MHRQKPGHVLVKGLQGLDLGCVTGELIVVGLQRFGRPGEPLLEGLGLGLVVVGGPQLVQPQHLHLEQGAMHAGEITNQMP